MINFRLLVGYLFFIFIKSLYEDKKIYYIQSNIYIYIYIYIYISNILSASEDNGCGLFACRIYEGFHINL